MTHASHRASKTWLEKSYIVSAAQGDRCWALKVNLRALSPQTARAATTFSVRNNCRPLARLPSS
jgi:hypothetical protein